VVVNIPTLGFAVVLPVVSANKAAGSWVAGRGRHALYAFWLAIHDSAAFGIDSGPELSSVQTKPSVPSHFSPMRSLSDHNGQHISPDVR
jgi:hypothetical protein